MDVASSSPPVPPITSKFGSGHTGDKCQGFIVGNQHAPKGFWVTYKTLWLAILPGVLEGTELERFPPRVLSSSTNIQKTGNNIKGSSEEIALVLGGPVAGMKFSEHQYHHQLHCESCCLQHELEHSKRINQRLHVTILSPIGLPIYMFVL